MKLKPFTLQAEPPIVFWVRRRKGGTIWITSNFWGRRSPNFGTSQWCSPSSNMFFECEHPFIDKPMVKAMPLLVTRSTFRREHQSEPKICNSTTTTCLLVLSLFVFFLWRLLRLWCSQRWWRLWGVRAGSPFFVAFRVFVALMGHWGGTLVAFTALIVFWGIGVGHLWRLQCLHHLWSVGVGCLWRSQRL